MNHRNARMLRRLVWIGIAAALVLPAVAAAGGRDNATLQNDIAHFGIPSSPSDSSGVTLRNDQAHFRPTGNASTPMTSALPRAVPVPIVVREDGGFDWLAAGVGAAAGFGLALLAAASTARRRHSVDPAQA
jgi:hypothetical protein